MPKELGRTKRVVIYLAEHGSLPGVTRGELRTALGLPVDAEITARIREAENDPRYGELDIRCMQVSKTEFRYWLPKRQQQKAQRLAARWLAENSEPKGRAA